MKFGCERPSASSGSQLGVPEDTTEFEDDQVEMLEKTARLAELIRQSKHVVVYTGAGTTISTEVHSCYHVLV